MLNRMVVILCAIVGIACGGGGAASGPTVLPPSSLIYSVNPATYFVSRAITPNTPSSGGGAVDSFSISPALPAGLSLNGTTGVIQGTPLAAAPIANYLITASNKSGSTNINLSIIIKSPSFLSVGQLNTARMRHTATILPNGKVLIAGGKSGTTLSTAEIYDSTLKNFTTITSNMTTPRMNHVSVLMNDGRVLLVGGTNENTDLSSAEIFDPTTGIFAATGSMNVFRGYGHSIVLLSSGKILITGGSNNSVAFLNDSELYDPTTGKFTRTPGGLIFSKIQHTATLLQNGKVLIAGGQGMIDPVNSDVMTAAELFNVSTGNYNLLSKGLNDKRHYHTATILINGMVLISGGSSFPTYPPLASAELYDPTSETFVRTGSMIEQREWHSSILLPNGKILVTGGFGAGTTGSGSLNSAELFDYLTGSFASTPTAMLTARQGHTMTMLQDGTVLIVGGEAASPSGIGPGTALTSAEVYQ